MKEFATAMMTQGRPAGTVRTSPAAKRDAARMPAASGVTLPDGRGRSGRLIRSISRSQRSLKTFPAAVMEKTMGRRRNEKEERVPVATIYPRRAARPATKEFTGRIRVTRPARVMA